MKSDAGREKPGMSLQDLLQATENNDNPGLDFVGSDGEIDVPEPIVFDADWIEKVINEVSEYANNFKAENEEHLNQAEQEAIELYQYLIKIVSQLAQLEAVAAKNKQGLLLVLIKELSYSRRTENTSNQVEAITKYLSEIGIFFALIACMQLLIMEYRVESAQEIMMVWLVPALIVITANIVDFKSRWKQEEFGEVFIGDTGLSLDLNDLDLRISPQQIQKIQQSVDRSWEEAFTTLRLLVKKWHSLGDNQPIVFQNPQFVEQMLLQLGGEKINGQKKKESAKDTREMNGQSKKEQDKKVQEVINLIQTEQELFHNLFGDPDQGNYTQRR